MGVWDLDLDFSKFVSVLEIFVPNLGFHVEFEGAKNPHVTIALNWGCGCCSRFLIGVWDLDLDFS